MEKLELKNLLAKHYYGDQHELVIAFKTGWAECLGSLHNLQLSTHSELLKLNEHAPKKGHTPWNKGLSLKQMQKYKKQTGKKRLRKKRKTSSTKLSLRKTR